MFAQSLERCEIFVELRSIIGNWYAPEYGVLRLCLWISGRLQRSG